MCIHQTYASYITKERTALWMVAKDGFHISIFNSGPFFSTGLCTRVFCLQFHFPFVFASFFSLAFPFVHTLLYRVCTFSLTWTLCWFPTVQQIFWCLRNEASEKKYELKKTFFSKSNCSLKMKCGKQKIKTVQTSAVHYLSGSHNFHTRLWKKMWRFLFFIFTTYTIVFNWIWHEYHISYCIFNKRTIVATTFFMLLFTCQTFN